MNRPFPHCTPVGVGVCNEKGQGPGGQCHKDHCFLLTKSFELMPLFLGKILWESSVVMKYILFNLFQEFI